MPPVSADNPPTTSQNEPLDVFDFDTFEDMDWTAVYGNYTLEGGLHAGSQDCDCHTEDLHIGPSHTSYGGRNSCSRVEAGSASSSMFDSWEMDIVAPVHDLHGPNDPFHASSSSEVIRQDLLIVERAVPVISSTTCSINNVMNNNRAQHGPSTAAFNWQQFHGITKPTSDSARIWEFMESTHDQSSNSHGEPQIAPSGWASHELQNMQHFQNIGRTMNLHYQSSAIQDPDLDFSWDSIDLHPNLQLPGTSTADSIRNPELQYSPDTPHCPAPFGEYVQDWGIENSLTRQHPSEPPSTNPQNWNIIYEDVPSWTQYGLDLVRTHSPENTRMISCETFSSVQHNILSTDSYGPIQIINRNHSYNSEPELSSARPKPYAAHLSRQQVKGRTRGGIEKKRPVRVLSESGKVAARAARRGGGTCEHCRYSKKQCTYCLSVPCHECKRIIGTWDYLGPAICSLRNYEQAFSIYSDLFDIVPRDKSIKSVLESMDGQTRDLLLGSGLQENGNLISIDFDSSRTCLVTTRRTKTILSQQWISTQDLNSNNGLSAPKDNSPVESYAIVTLPELAHLDTWGRQGIQDLAQKWPSCLEAKYALAFLKYVGVSPPLPCYNIVQHTLRIISLGKNLDSRRPIDHNKIVNMIINLPHSSFGIEEFNERKANFQLSMPARLQLYIHAARGIEETQRTLGKELDDLFKNTVNGRTRDNILVVGACLRCLGLEYRNRLQRYREFPSGEVDDRIERCSFTYVFFTRLYDHWYRGRTLPMSPDWSVFDYSQGLRNDKDLVEAFSELSFLEQEFCNTRLDESNEADSIYKTLIVNRASGKPGKPYQTREVRSF